MRYSIIFLLLFLGVSCTPQEKATSDLTFTWTAEPRPLHPGPTKFILKFNENDVVSVEAEATMTHPGMIPVFGSGVKQENGEFHVNLTTTMSGSWIMFLKIKKSNETIIEKNFNFEITR